MSEVSIDKNEKSKDIFNALSFERKLVELIEELRLRRNLEIESEKTLKSIMDEKYNEELNWDELRRRYIREKDDLEQQIDILKRKLEDKVCLIDDDKAKQHVISRTYSHEIKMLKEELRASKSEKLNLQKKIQELEGKLNLHNNFEESIMAQIEDVRKSMKSILEESQKLTTAQKNVMENVASAKLFARKYDLCNQHLQQSMKIVGKKSEALKNELISSRSELTILKNSMPGEKKKSNNNLEIEKLQKKNMELENLLLVSRKENEKTLQNFLESNNLLCKFMEKYSETQDREKVLLKEIEQSKEKLVETEKKLQDTLDDMKRGEEKIALKEKQRIQNQRSVDTQTENHETKCSTEQCNTLLPASSDSSPRYETDFMETMRQNLVGLQQSAIINQSETFIKDFPLGSRDRKITFSEVLKRKIEVVETMDEIKLLSFKRRFTENTVLPVFDIRTGEDKEKVLLPVVGTDVQSCSGTAPKRERELNILVDQKYLQLVEETPKKFIEEKEENKYGDLKE